MGLSAFQRGVCRLLAQNRISSGESYLAGGATPNELLHAPRLSRGLDVFHDTEEALVESWRADRVLLAAAGYDVHVFRERHGFVEAEVRRGNDLVLLEWARDSAFRFFPLVEHEDLGLTLHPFDLATSKVLALVGRLEPRDFVDTLACDVQIQPLGLLAWAASGKDPGFSPAAILEEAARVSRYSAEELTGLDFEGPPPNPQELSLRWRNVLAIARQVVDILPPDQAGRAVLDQSGAPFRGDIEALREALRAGGLLFHPGTIRGAWPRLISG